MCFILFQACIGPPYSSVSAAECHALLRMPSLGLWSLCLEGLLEFSWDPGKALSVYQALKMEDIFIRSLSPPLVEQTIKTESFLVLFREHSFPLVT